jgi:prepilin-type N-terminal cleavage/methylation domain-containing protein
MKTPSHPRIQRGFSILELAVVLVIIGVIIGTVTIGRDVQRNAQHQRVITEFVQGWQLAYDNYRAGVGVVPGDNLAAPTGAVNAGAAPLCGLQLRTVMQARGIQMPSGRAEGSEDLYAYLDKNGNPQQLSVCFESVSWSEPGATPGTYVVRQRNVMVLAGLTPALATTLDNQVDGRVDARHGRLRESSVAANSGAASIEWSATERVGRGTTGTDLDESQSVSLTGFLRMGT